jgi:hypothetical protein
MTIKVVGLDGNPFDQNSVEARGDRFLREFVLLQLSGNYTTNGDTLDLTNGGGTSAFPNVLPPAASRGLADIDLIVRATTNASLLAVGGGYAIIAPNANTPLKFSDLATLKLKVFKNTAGSVAEYPQGAYGADVLADIIMLELPFVR